MDTPYMINIISGIINVITRFVKSIFFVSATLASSKRSSSFFSLPNARITGNPVKISLATRLILSTKICIFLKRGIATPINTMTTATSVITATTMIHSIPDLVLSTLMIPPIPMIGAYRIIRKTIVSTIWICWISFVLRVISDAVEN